jgi:hypothetical protein
VRLNESVVIPNRMENAESIMFFLKKDITIVKDMKKEKKRVRKKYSDK